MKPITKQRPLRDARLRYAIGLLDCVRCGHPSDGSIVPAHYFGPRRDALGGGMAHKASDAACAALCGRCHAWMDAYKDGNTWERSEEFLFLVVLTHDALLKRGLLMT